MSRFRLQPISDGPYNGCYKPTSKGLVSILCNPVYIGWWIPQNGGCVEDNHEAIVSEGLFTFAHKRLSMCDLSGNRQKPERVVRNGKVQALLKKVLRSESNRRSRQAGRWRQGRRRGGYSISDLYPAARAF